jgi:hypothetical protein
MRIKTFTILVLWLALFQIAGAHECRAYETPLLDLLDQYKETYGTKFVVDPRVRANVNLVGIETDSINSALLIGILNMHGFTARTKDGVVYVMPFPVAEASGDKFGVQWEG